MKLKIMFSVILVTFIVFVQVSSRKMKNPKLPCGKRRNTAAGNSIGGKPAEKNSFPWLVAFRLLPTNEFFCGGSLVSVKHVISAAHCFQNKIGTGNDREKSPQEVLALLGKHDLNDDEEEGSMVHSVNDLIVHEDWVHTDVDYDADLALVVLETEVDLTNTVVSVVCLPTMSENEVEVTGEGTIAGWGISERSIADREVHDSKPNELKLPAVTRDQCLAASEELDSISSDRTFCAGFVNQNKSACQGDSGGGFYLYDSLKRGLSVAGIVSASLIDPYSTCRIDIYSIFTDVTKYVDWIEEKMNETLEIKWTEVEFQCDKENGSSITNCWHNFRDSITQNMKIRQSYAMAASTEDMFLYFHPSSLIFEGIGENFRNLKTLRINNQKIKFLERKNFKNLQNLVTLYLYQNDLEFLHEAVFWDLPNLTNLSLSGNLFKTLPSKIFDSLTKLELLFLENNKIEELPRDLFSENLELKKIYTYDNPLKKFDFELSRAPDVKLFNETWEYYYQRSEKFYFNETKVY